MCAQIIDRRADGKNKSAVNRERFMRRNREAIRQAVTKAIEKRSITDIDKGENIVIPSRDISEPIFQHGVGGEREFVHPGNQEFVAGDNIKRPMAGAGQGKNSIASDKGEGEDDFVFEISRKEFLELFFDDLELPNLIKQQMAKLNAFKWLRAGFTTDGVPANINIIRSLRAALARRIALTSSHQRQVVELEKKLDELLETTTKEDERVVALLEEIELKKERISKVPFIDTFDLRYNNRIKKPCPSTQAVVFFLMDVSGSMDETKKDIAKRFFILLYLFLTRTYDQIDVVFIRHHTSAKEVNEEEFFYSRETGGTVVSSALDKMHEIMLARYPSDEWNIYAAQASDGDNWNNDSPRCQSLMLEKIIPYTQYFAYVEILPRHHQSLWEAYLNVKKVCPNFAMQHIENASDIYPVFRELFKRQTHE